MTTGGEQTKLERWRASVVDRVSRAVSESTAVKLLSRGTERLRHWAGESVVMSMLDLARNWLSKSATYSWFTTEPDDSLIRVQLRDSAILGPIVCWLASKYGELTHPDGKAE